MQQSTQITFQNLTPSDALGRRIREKCEDLERFHPQVRYCRVTVEQDARHSAGARPFRVVLRVGVTGRELVADRSHDVDAVLAVRDAFTAMRRQLQDAADIAAGEVKSHSLPQPEESP